MNMTETYAQHLQFGVGGGGIIFGATGALVTTRGGRSHLLLGRRNLTCQRIQLHTQIVLLCSNNQQTKKKSNVCEPKNLIHKVK